MASLGEVKVTFGADLKPLQTGFKKAESSINKVAGKMKKIGTTATASITAPLIGIGTVAVASADKLDKAMNQIQVETGATGEHLNVLKKDFNEVFANVPVNADTAAGAIASLNTLTKATGDVLQGLTTNVLEASRVLGEDGAGNAQLFGQAMQQWQVPAEQGTTKLDALFKATQNYGVGLNQIINLVNEYGSVMQNAGFTMEQAADFFGRLQAAGINVSRVMPGLNMAFRNWSKEGKNVREELQRTIAQMKSAGTETEALKIAAEEFGAEGAQRITTAIRTGTIPALADLGSELAGAQGLIEETADRNRTLGDSFREMRNRLMLAAEPLGGSFLQAFESLEPTILGAIKRIQSLVDWFSNLNSGTQKILITLAGVAVAIGPLLTGVGLLATAIPGVVVAVRSLTMAMIGLNVSTGGIIAAIGALVTGAIYLAANWETVSKQLGRLFTFIKDIGIASFELLRGVLVKVFATMASFILDKINRILKAVEPITRFLPPAWQNAFTSLRQSVEANMNHAAMASERASASIQESLQKAKIATQQLANQQKATGQSSAELDAAMEELRQRAEVTRGSTDNYTAAVTTNTAAIRTNTAATTASTAAKEDEYTIMEQLQDKLEIVGKKMQLWKASTDAERESTEYLTKEIEFQRQKLEVVNQQVARARELYEQSAAAKGEDAEATRKLKMELLELQTQQAELRKEIEETTESMKEQTKYKVIDGVTFRRNSNGDLVQADLGGGSGNFDKEEREEFKRENPDAPDWLFHDGGLVTKHGPDEVPALLQTGEYVIPREGVRVKGGNNDDEGPVTIVVELDGRQIARGTMPHLEREIRLKTGVTY